MCLVAALIVGKLEIFMESNDLAGFDQFDVYCQH
jgi:hypothetical protein